MMLTLFVLATEAAATTQPTPQPLSAAGWAFMLGSITLVLLLFGFCLTKVLGGPADPGARMHGPLDIDTGDYGT